MAGQRETARNWSFLTSHAVTLVEVTRTPDATVRDLSERTNLTERQLHRVLDDLVAAGYVARTRVGRRNHYAIDTSRPMRHPSVDHHLVAKLISTFTP
jgi:DNA-binding MarR family transcriptional regulator